MGLFGNNKTKNDSSHDDEYAEIIDWPLKWDTGAPMPQVFGNGHKTFLIYMVNEPDPKWDGTSISVIDNSSENEYPLAIVEFDGGTFRFGIANEDVFGGLSVAEKGMDWYEAHTIQNSMWIKELKTIHKIHPYYQESSWSDRKHYMLLFHDEMFEVIAKGYKVERFNSTFKNLAKEVIERMNK